MQASHPEPNAGLAETKIRARLDGLGGMPMPMTAAEFGNAGGAQGDRAWRDAGGSPFDVVLPLAVDQVACAVRAARGCGGRRTSHRWRSALTCPLPCGLGLFEKGPTWGIVGGLEKVCLWSPPLSCLVPLASRSWPHTSGRADWGFLVRQPRWPRAIGKATFGKATSGTPYSPSSSGWFGFTARKHPCPEAREVRSALPT
jgi:hypothetical protein